MLREKTQRRLFRVLFLVGCVLPTTAIAAWSLARTHPAYHRTMLHLAGRSLGVQIECDRISTPRPGEYQLEGVRVFNRWSEAKLATCDRAVARRDQGIWRLMAGECRLLADTHAWPTPPSRKASGAISAKIAALRLVNSNQETLCAWNHVRCEVGQTNDEPDAPDFRVWTETEAADSATRLAVYHEPHATRLELETGATPLPLSLLPGLLPQTVAGAAAFIGEVAIESEDRVTHGEARGAVEIGRAEGAHASWSNARVDLLELAWTEQRIERLHAHVEAREGSLNRLFVWGLYQMLKCQPERALEAFWTRTPDNTPVPFERLACEVELDATGLTLYGRCGESAEGSRPGAIAHAILADKEKPLLLEPRDRRQPAANFVRALWPTLVPQVPATAEAESIASRLPLQKEERLR